MAGRITQDVVEVAILADNSKVRVSQDALEIAILPDTAKVRTSQTAVEVAIVPSSQKARVTQLVVEVAALQVDASAALTVVATGIAIIARQGAGSASPALIATCDGSVFNPTIGMGESDAVLTATATSQIFTATIGGGTSNPTLTAVATGATSADGGISMLHLTATGIGVVSGPAGGSASLMVVGQLSSQRPVVPGDYLLGDGVPFGYPQGLEILAGIGPSGELVDITDDVNRETITITRRAVGGVSRSTFSMRQEVGNSFDAVGLAPVFIKDSLRTYGGGRYYRMFGGWTESSTANTEWPEREVPVENVGMDRILDFPPANGFTWPESYDNQGTPVVATSSATPITTGTGRHFFVVSGNNIVAGKLLTAVNTDGSNEEEITITSIGASGNGLEVVADFTSPKSAGWLLVGGLHDDELYASGWTSIAFKTVCPDAVSTTGVTHTVKPLPMVAMTAGDILAVFNPDNHNFEYVKPFNITSTSFDAVFSSTKSGNWRIHVYHYYRGFIDTFYNDVQTTPVAAAIVTPTTNMTITPTVMEHIVRGRTMWCQNVDGSNGEEVFVSAVGLTTFTADFTLPKSAGWLCFNGPWVSKAGVARVVKSLGHILYTGGTPRKFNADVRSRNTNPAVAPRDFISFLEDSPDHLTVFGPIWYHYDALSSNLATIELSDYTTIDPDTQARYQSSTLVRNASSRFNAITVTGKNGVSGSWTDPDWRVNLGRIWYGETVQDANLITVEECEDRAETIVRNNLNDLKTFTVVTNAEVSPYILREPFRVRLYDQANFTSYRNYPVAAVSLSYPNGVQQYAFELNEFPADLDGQLMPFGLGRRGHNTTTPASLSGDFAVTDGSGVTRVPDEYLAIYDRHGHFAGFAPSKPVDTRTASFSPIELTRTYRIDASGGDRVVVLPPPEDMPYRRFTFKKVDASIHTITISSGVGVDAPTALDFTLSSQGHSVTVESDPESNTWNVTASHLVTTGLGLGLVSTMNFIGGNKVAITAPGPTDSLIVGFPVTIVGVTVRLVNGVVSTSLFNVERQPAGGGSSFSALNPSPFGPSGNDYYNTVDLTGWETLINALDDLRVSMTSNTAAQGFTVGLHVARQ